MLLLRLETLSEGEEREATIDGAGGREKLDRESERGWCQHVKYALTTE